MKANFKATVNNSTVLIQRQYQWQIDGETIETVTDLISWSPKSLQMVTAAMKLKDTCSLEEEL